MNCIVLTRRWHNCAWPVMASLVLFATAAIFPKLSSADDSTEEKKATESQPAEPGKKDPAEPKAKDPAEPKAKDPAEPKAKDPAEPKAKDPAGVVKPEPKKPVEPAAAEPDGPNIAVVKQVDALAAKATPTGADVTEAVKLLHNALKGTKDDSLFNAGEWKRVRTAVEKLSAVEQSVDARVAARLGALRLILAVQRDARAEKDIDFAPLLANAHQLAVKEGIVLEGDVPLLLHLLDAVAPKLKDDPISAVKLAIDTKLLAEKIPDEPVVSGYAVRNDSRFPVKLNLGTRGRPGDPKTQRILRPGETYESDSVDKIIYWNGEKSVEAELQAKQVVVIYTQTKDGKSFFSHKSAAGPEKVGPEPKTPKQEKPVQPEEGKAKPKEGKEKADEGKEKLEEGKENPKAALNRYRQQDLAHFQQVNYLMQLMPVGLMLQPATTNSEETLEGSRLTMPPAKTAETNPGLDKEYTTLHTRSYQMASMANVGRLVDDTRLLAYDCLLLALNSQDREQKDERLKTYFTAFRRDLDKRYEKANKDPKKSEAITQLLESIKEDLSTIDELSRAAEKVKVPEPVVAVPTTLEGKIASLEAQLGSLEYRVNSQQQVTYDLVNGRAMDDQRYSDWQESQNGKYYFCKFHFRPQGMNDFLSYDCIWFADDADYVYYYTRRYCTYWGRYSMTSRLMETVPENQRYQTQPGCIPDKSTFTYLNSPPAVPFSVNPKQRMIAPNLVGLPGVAASYDWAPMPMSDESAPAEAKPFDPDSFGAPVPAAPLPPAPPAE